MLHSHDHYCNHKKGCNNETCSTTLVSRTKRCHGRWSGCHGYHFTSIRGNAVLIKPVGFTCDFSASTSNGSVAFVTSAKGDCCTSYFASVIWMTVQIKLVGIAGDSRAHIFVGTRVAGTTGYRRTTNFTPVCCIVVGIKLVGSAGDGRACVFVGALD